MKDSVDDNMYGVQSREETTKNQKAMSIKYLQQYSSSIVLSRETRSSHLC